MWYRSLRINIINTTTEVGGISQREMGAIEFARLGLLEYEMLMLPKQHACAKKYHLNFTNTFAIRMENSSIARRNFRNENPRALKTSGPTEKRMMLAHAQKCLNLNCFAP